MQKESTNALEDDENHKREKLKTKRKRLFERFLNNPANIGLALEIKSIDDYVAEYTQQMKTKIMN